MMSSLVATSESERKYTLEGCEANIRADGRRNSDYRPYLIETDSLIQLSNGSSRVYLPNRSTDVVCSVKGEIVAPSLKHPSRGLLEIQVEFLSKNTKKRQRRSEEMELSHILSSLLLEALPIDKLCIVPGRYCWKLFVDVLVLSCNGNSIDACSMAVYTALNTTYLPLVTPLVVVSEESTLFDSDAIIQQQQQQQKKAIVEDLLVDGDASNADVPPGAADCPMTVTVCRLGNKIVLDCNGTEEDIASAKVTVSVDKSRRICGIHKCGEGSMPFRQLAQVTQLAVDVSTAKLFEVAEKSIRNASDENYGDRSILSNPIEFR